MNSLKKQSIKYSLCLLGFIAIHFGCNKQNETISPNTETNTITTTSNARTSIPSCSFVAIENNIVCFNSIENYIEVAEMWDNNRRKAFVNDLFNSDGYTSLKSAFLKGDSVGLDSLYPDDFISAVLNKDKLVKIGKYYVKVNRLDGTVLALDQAYCQDVQKLIGSDPQNQNILRFTIEDDVVDLLLNNPSTNAKPTFCTQSGISGQDSPLSNWSTIGTVSGITYKFRGHVTFNKYGIYYSLKARVRIDPKASSIADMRINFKNLFYQQRCGWSGGPYAATDLVSGTSYEKEYQSYQGVKNLNKLCVKAYFSLHGMGSTYWTNDVTIQKNCSQ